MKKLVIDFSNQISEGLALFLWPFVGRAVFQYTRIEPLCSGEGPYGVDLLIEYVLACAIGAIVQGRQIVRVDPRLPEDGKRYLKIGEDEVGMNGSAENDLVDYSVVEDLIELVSVGFEVFGVLVILVGVGWATSRFVLGEYHRSHRRPYFQYKIDMGLALLLGLEVLVAADIIGSIAVDPSFTNLGVLAILVTIRTLLGWVLVLETEGRWPWQQRASVDAEVAEREGNGR